MHIPEVIGKLDRVEKGIGEYEGHSVIRFIKTIEGRETVVTYVQSKKHDIRVQTMYAGTNKKSLATTPGDNNIFPQTSEALSGTASIDSIPQSSQKSTKKYSIDIDDSLFDTLQETYSTQEQETASIIQEGFASLKKVTVDEKVMHRIAYDIKKAYKSNYDIDKLQSNLTRVFAYLKDHADSVGYKDMVRIVQEVAKPVIQESTDIDTFEKEIYENFRKNFGNLTFSDKRTYLDNLWSEICDNSYEMLDRGGASADEPISQIDALDALRPVKKNIYGMDTEQVSYDLALDILKEEQKVMLAHEDMEALNAAQRRVKWYTTALVKINQRANDRIMEIKVSNRWSMLNKRRNEELKNTENASRRMCSAL